MDRHAHWESVYGNRSPTEVSWYTPHLRDSLRLIRGVSSVESSIIDVGGGASTLVDDLLELGYRHLTVLDISETALAHARQRLGERAALVTWVTADVTSAALPDASYDLWHDRAVFHFLTEEVDRRAYVRALLRKLKIGGHAVVGTFSLHGPEKCSGLDVVRYDAVKLAKELAPGLTLSSSEEGVHVTPAGKEQRFLLSTFERTE